MKTSATGSNGATGAPAGASGLSDERFLGFFDLARPAMADARRAAEAGDPHRAALLAAAAAGEGGPLGPIPAGDIAATRAAILRHAPAALELERAVAELWLRPELPSAESLGFVDGRRLHTLARVGRARGNETLQLALLWATTGERRYADAAVRAGLAHAGRFPLLPQDGLPPAYAWHPHATPDLNREFDLQMQYWLTAWSILDPLLAAEERLAWMKAMLPVAWNRLLATAPEIPFNLTLHPILPALLLATAFPALKDAAAWLDRLRDRLERDFCAAPFSTPDGYTREGSGYQDVNTRLLMLAHLAVSRSGRDWPILRAASERAFAMQALFVCPDGSGWIIGDAHALSFHEPWLDAHEALHLGAALFDRPEWKAAAGSPATTTPNLVNLWLMGSAGIARWAAWPAIDLAHRPLAHADAPQSCFHVLRAGAGIDGHAGILAFGSDFNHAHHDKSQVLLYGLGRHLLSDHGHPGFPPSDMVPGFSSRVHGVASVVRRTPMGPRTDHLDHVRSLGRCDGDGIAVAAGEHWLYENHVVQRALALVTPAQGEAFWLVWDRIAWKRGWPGGGNEPLELIETVFPFHAPGCGARVAADGRSCWSRYDGPDGAPYAAGWPSRAELRAANEYADSDANLQVVRLDSPANPTEWDLVIQTGTTNTCGLGQFGNASELVERPLGVFRYRGRLPHVAAYVLVPFRGVRELPYAVATGAATEDGVTAEVVLPSGRFQVGIAGIGSGRITASVARG